MTDQSALERLATAVRERRGELGLRQGDLAARGGPGVVKVGQIERAEAIRAQTLTLSRLDAALDWPAGTAARILTGAAPVEAVPDQASASLEDAIRSDSRLIPEAREHLLKQLGLLLRIPPDPPLPNEGRDPTPLPPEEKLPRAARRVASVKQQDTSPKTPSASRTRPLA